MLTDEQKANVDKFYRKKRRAERIYLLQRFLCFFQFHAPHYKYRELSDEEKAIRRKQSVSPECFRSTAPEHLGYHCRVCDLPLGQYRNKRFWFQIKWPR